MPKKNPSAPADEASGLFAQETAPAPLHGADAGVHASTVAISARASRRTARPGETPALPATYEAGVQELEALIGRIESGQMPLDQLLTGYQRGAQLLAFCRGRLEAVEQQIRVLDGAEAVPWPRGEGEAS